MASKRVAKIKLSGESSERPVLDIVVSRGTTVKGSIRVIDSLDSIIERLTGCPCISGLDIRLRDSILNEKVQSFKQDITLPG